MHSISKLLNVHYIHKNLFSHINCHFYFIVFQILILPSSWDPKAPYTIPPFGNGLSAIQNSKTTPKVEQVECTIIES